MSLSSLLRKAIGDFRHNKAAAFTHGVRVLTTPIIGASVGLGVLAHLGVIRPIQMFQAAGYALVLLTADFVVASDLALGLRFVAPDLFGFLSLSTFVTGVTVVGALSIACRWHRSRS